MSSIFRSSIARMLCGWFLLLAILVITFSIASHSVSVRIVRREMVANYANTLRTVAIRFSDQLSDLTNTASIMLLDDDVNAMSISTREIYDLFQYMQISRRLKLYANERELSGNVTLIFPKQKWALSSRYGVERLNSYGALNASVVSLRDKGAWGIYPSLRNADTSCFSVVHGYAHEKQTSAILSIELPQETVLDSIRLLSGHTEVIDAFLLDSAGNRFADETIPYPWEKIVSESPDDENIRELRLTLDGQECSLLLAAVPKYGCTVGLVLDNQQLVQPVVSIQSWFIGMLILSFLTCIAFILLIYRGVFAPVRDILETFAAVREGDLTARAYVRGRNEFGEIASQFNVMADRLQTLIKTNYLNEISNKRIQLRFLRAQIKPHFLYNCLFGLYSMIKSEDLENAEDMAIYLGEYFRINTHADLGEVALEEELTHVRVFLKIQAMRYPGVFEYREEIDEGLRDMRIPQLTVLTVIENAVTHGFSRKGPVAELVVSAKTCGGEVRLIIADSGTGVTPEMLEALHRRLAVDINEETETHGLQNIYQRLQMIIGDGVRMTFSHNQPSGLIVTILIPVT